MDADRTPERREQNLVARPADAPRPTHPWPASIALVIGVIVLLVVLSLMSTFR